ncbi:hypothetical protein PW52_10130 [Tamlana sedimentorum]|uniref:Uncharacterized protein n=1 Tax=Neotamlana sedimentorum TaxID=1435349 RepID=A0A0D7W8R3_9FLAO|nr:hypothetical protein [Tamlana sedimentorum]KJD35444.1 hypothetical protein PW52_10130 [Tamlana sedimentorum]
MKHCLYIFISFSFSVFSQNIETKFTKSIPFKADIIFSIDNFKNVFYKKENVFYVDSKDRKTSYNNIQLGELADANTFNPLKINLFYKDFNTVVILDNRLAEIFKIDFNSLHPYRTITHISTAFDNTIWVFNQDLQNLELYNYKTNKVKAQTRPIQSEVLDIESNYNYCWLLTKNYLYVYNYFGSLIKKIDNEGYTKIAQSNENIILKKDNELFFLEENSTFAQPIQTSNLKIKQFFVTNESLYIYNNESLQEFQLKI